MSKKILIISTSPRKGSNSDALAEEFAKGARDAGHKVEKVSLIGKDIQFCRGCLACQKTKRCVIHDDADKIVQEQMLHADVLVFATPIYYYEMSGQMKTLLDRANPLYPSDYAFRDVYLIATAAEDGDEVWARAASGLEGWVECFPRAHFSGVIFGGNAADIGAIQSSPAMQKAYDAGKAVR
jgi:multimeric flavodoxin WrbA